MGTGRTDPPVSWEGPTVGATSNEDQDTYTSNTALYDAAHLIDGTDYVRRHTVAPSGCNDVVVIAPHGGRIEPGTSELCLAIAGQHPTNRAHATPGYAYWMFEGLRQADNADLHVTSTHCDDPIAIALCRGARHALSVHGCTPSSAGLSESARAVLVGGRDQCLRLHLVEELTETGFTVHDASNHASLNGLDRRNIVNRTLLGQGAQLEITAPLREAMFTVHTVEDRAHNTTEVYWDFTRAVRNALARRLGT